MLKDRIKKNLSQYWLTCQTLYRSHETNITP